VLTLVLIDERLEGRRKTKQGNLPVLRLGKRTLVPVTAIENLLEQAS
jgi:hypothetical protein